MTDPEAKSIALSFGLGRYLVYRRMSADFVPLVRAAVPIQHLRRVLKVTFPQFASVVVDSHRKRVVLDHLDETIVDGPLPANLPPYVEPTGYTIFTADDGFVYTRRVMQEDEEEAVRLMQFSFTFYRPYGMSTNP